jgi:hypothetical protein
MNNTRSLVCGALIVIGSLLALLLIYAWADAPVQTISSRDGMYCRVHTGAVVDFGDCIKR